MGFEALGLRASMFQATNRKVCKGSGFRDFRFSVMICASGLGVRGSSCMGLRRQDSDGGSREDRLWLRSSEED